MLAIQAEGLGKKYQLRHQPGATTLRDALAAGGRSFFQGGPGTIEEFWALRQASFDIKPGERVGIIGRNGAGKSTLLKLLSRITEPSEGRARLRGRVASLLEVGTGFHPELSGRENIFLNGAVLGMGRAELRKKFDAIVAFAEVEKFLDTPVKRYSSGMYMRLAFSIAAHLEPEILIVDEVLAVGDADFQKKCLGRMQEISGEGRTVLFVSHQMSAVERLCTRILTLDQGCLAGDSTDVKGALGRYLREVGSGAAAWENDGSLVGSIFVPEAFFISDSEGRKVPGEVSNNGDFGVSVTGLCKADERALNVGLAVYDMEGRLLLWSCQTDSPERDWPVMVPGHRYHLRCALPKRLLNEGSYRVELILALYNREWICEPGRNSPSIRLDIHGGLSDSPYWPARRPGQLGPCWPWTSSDETGR